MREPDPAASSTAPTVMRLYRLPPPLRTQPTFSLRSRTRCRAAGAVGVAAAVGWAAVVVAAVPAATARTRDGRRIGQRQGGFAATRARCPLRRVATTAASTDKAISSGVCAPINWPAGAMIARTASASCPASISDSRSTWALRALATNQIWRACKASVARKSCRSRGPWMATTTKLLGATCAATTAASSLAISCSASTKRSASAPCAIAVTCRPTRDARPTRATATGESPITVSRARGSIGSMNSSSVPPE